MEKPCGSWPLVATSKQGAKASSTNMTKTLSSVGKHKFLACTGRLFCGVCKLYVLISFNNMKFPFTSGWMYECNVNFIFMSQQCV